MGRGGFPRAKSTLQSLVSNLRQVLGDVIPFERGSYRLDLEPESVDAKPPPISSSDQEDNYLIALASSSRSVLVSGDKDLLVLKEQIPVYSPAEFLALIDESGPNPTWFQASARPTLFFIDPLNVRS